MTTAVAIFKSEGEVTFCGMEYFFVMQAARLSMMDVIPKNMCQYKMFSCFFFLFFLCFFSVAVVLLAGTMDWHVPCYCKDETYLAKPSFPKAFSSRPTEEAKGSP